MSDLPDVAVVPDYSEPWEDDLARLQWERAVAEALAGGAGMDPDYIAALGKVDLTGYQNVPTLIDPINSTDYDDAGWLQLQYQATGVQQIVGFGDDVAHALHNANDTATRQATQQLQAVGGAVTTLFYTQAAVASDGTGLNTLLDVFATGQSGELFYELTDTKSHLLVVGQAAQTSPLLDLQDSAALSVLQVTGDRKVGFYGQAPVALQTGVAVNAAGIHAALVNLGLITA